MSKCFVFFFLPVLLFASLDEVAKEIVEVGEFLNQNGLCPATSGNFSSRVDEGLIAVTVSGRHKGELTVNDVILVGLDGSVKNSTRKASAEMLLHTMLYAFDPGIGAVLHTHSTNGIVLTRLIDEDEFFTVGYEIHKAFPGIKTHESALTIPIFENSQDIAELALVVSNYLKEHPDTFGFLLRGHGFYTWGKNLKEARYRVEAFEQLFDCELKLRMLGTQ
ncbi:MAG: methylthioribulose 1-phosphate dehydratase [Chlamydiae bacterium]|nr:methylthioribulose 1-phosphate dehydratase [Chlamydiota bacterium]